MEHAPLFDDVAEAPEGGAAYWRKTADGLRIRVAAWGKEGAKGTVLLFPGRTEYIEKYGRAVGELHARGFASLVVDWRGQGLADRLTGDRATGHVHIFHDYQHDVEAALQAARDLGLPEPYYLLAHSMGGCIGLRALQNGLPVKAAVFTGPMWGIVIAPWRKPVAIALSRLSRALSFPHFRAPGTGGETYVKLAPFKGNMLTTDPEMFAYMKRQTDAHPELALGGPSLGWLHEALGECRALAAMPAPDLPTLTFLGSNERIVSKPAITARMASWPAGRLELVEGCEHEAMMEIPAIRDRVFDATAAHFAAHGGA